MGYTRWKVRSVNRLHFENIWIFSSSLPWYGEQLHSRLDIKCRYGSRQGCPGAVIELPRAESSSAWPYHHTVALQLTNLYKYISLRQPYSHAQRYSPTTVDIFNAFNILRIQHLPAIYPAVTARYSCISSTRLRINENQRRRAYRP